MSDREGRLVPNLEKDRFRVLDNGRPTDITIFSHEAQPITVAVMLDMSGSMGVRLSRVRESTERFIDAIAPTIGLASVRSGGTSPSARR